MSAAQFLAYNSNNIVFFKGAQHPKSQIGGSQIKKLIIIFAVTLLLCTFTLQATAADWSFYGSARVKTWSYSESAKASDTGYERTDTVWDLQGNSRIGATVKADNIGGRFEYGTAVNLRRLYGTWDFGKGVLLVGQEYTPLDFTISSQVVGSDLTLNGWGTTLSRKPMLQVEIMNFSIALVRPDTSDLDGQAADEQVILPSLEADYTYLADRFMVKAIAGFSTYEIVDVNDNKDRINRWITGVAGTYNFGAAYVSSQFQFGQNLGTWNITADFAGASNASPVIVNGSVKNNFGFGYGFEGGYKLNDTFKFAAGLGGVSYKVDMSGAKRDNAISTYLNSQINVTKNAFVVPEIGYFDNMKDGAGNSEGNIFYLGAKWQVNF